MKELFPIQAHSKEILRDALRKHGAALNSSAVGTGKTLVSVELVKDEASPCFVVAPKVVLPSWRKTFEEQGVSNFDAINYEKLRAGNTPFGRWRTKQIFEWALPQNTIIVVDECHRCKGVGTKNSRMLRAAKDQGYRVLMLSATAAESPCDLWAIGYVLGLHNGGNFTKWALSWGATIDPWRRLTFPKKNKHKLQELHQLIYPDRGHKISRADMAEFFSETRIQVEPLDFGDDGSIQKLYDDMEEELQRLEQTASKDRGANALTARLRARQAVEILKVPALAGMVEDYLDQGCSVAVFLSFHESMEALEQRLKVPCSHISGRHGNREAEIEAFQTNETHVILCQVSAGGVGVNLHDLTGERPRVALVSPTDSAMEIEQILGRIDRAGAKTDTIQRILFAAGTIEEEVAKNFGKKIEQMRILHADLKNDVDHITKHTKHMPTPPMPAQEPQPAHAEFGPSSLKMFEICPGYTGREGTNPAAEMGTRIHEALELDDLSKLTTDIEIGIAESCLETLGHIIAHHNLTNYEDHREIRLDIDLNDGLSTFGTCDRLLIQGNVGVQVDWKTGVSVIDDAEVNCQAQAYTLGSFQRFPQLQEIHFYFVIPQRGEVSYAKYTRDDIPRIQLRLSTVIRRAKEARKCWAKGENVPVESLNPTPGVCDYCANQAKCTAVTKKVLTIAAKYEGDNYPLPEEVHGSLTHDPAAIAQMLRFVPIAEKWAAGVKERAKEMAFDDFIEIPGFECRERAGRKTIKNAAAAWDAVKDKMTIDDFLLLVGDIPFNAIADKLYDQAPRGKKTAAKNEFECALRDAEALADSPTQRFLSPSKK